MPLASANWQRPKANKVLPVAVVQTLKFFDDTANKRWVIDVYATVNALIRLEKRILITPVYSGMSVTFTRKVLDYSISAASTYDPTSLASATTAPFTIALGVEKEELDLNAFYTLAGVAPADV